MDAGEYARFTLALRAALENRPDVLGLVLLGSTAGMYHAPDTHSDHDFFVIVPAEQAGAYRTSTDWLPSRAVRIVHHHRDTPHGARVIYADGHLLEYAVFTPDEIALSRTHHVAVVLNRVGDLHRRVDATRPDPAAPPIPDVPGALSDLMVHLLVGVGRYARGERLAAHHMIRVLAVQDHLTLLTALPPARPDLTDARNVWRRVEHTYLEHAAALEAALSLPLPAGAAWLLNLAEAWWSGHPAWPADTAQAVRQRIEASGRPTS